MANTTFTGPVRSQNGFKSITKNATTGAITENSTYGDDAEVSGTLTVTGAATLDDLTAAGTVIFSNLPTSDPSVEGQLWSDSGVLTVSAG